MFTHIYIYIYKLIILYTVITEAGLQAQGWSWRECCERSEKRRGFQGEGGAGTPWDKDVFCIIFGVRFWITFLLVC